MDLKFVLFKDFLHFLIALTSASVNFTKATTKALDKAMIKHNIKQLPKQEESTGESIDSIDKQLNQETIEQLNKETNDALLAQSPPVEILIVDDSEKQKKEKSSAKKEKGEKNVINTISNLRILRTIGELFNFLPSTSISLILKTH